MSKRGLGKYITFAAILGAVVTGVSYFVKYKSFHKELEEDFHDFEDEFDDGFKEELTDDKENLKRTYVSINREPESTPEEIEDAEDIEEDPADEVPPSVSITISEDEDMYN